jgi:hypothetical protein
MQEYGKDELQAYCRRRLATEEIPPTWKVIDPKVLIKEGTIR